MSHILTCSFMNSAPKSPKRNYLNLRKHPFRFPSAKEVAQNVTEPGETSKRQLLFYETAMLPENLQ